MLMLMVVVVGMMIRTKDKKGKVRLFRGQLDTVQCSHCGARLPHSPILGTGPPVAAPPTYADHKSSSTIYWNIITSAYEKVLN